MSHLLPKFDPEQVNAAIDLVFAEEKNEAVRYNPFLLLEPDDEFDRILLQNAREKSLKSFLVRE